jgi:hypothetical protein
VGDPRLFGYVGVRPQITDWVRASLHKRILRGGIVRRLRLLWWITFVELRRLKFMIEKWLAKPDLNWMPWLLLLILLLSLTFISGVAELVLRKGRHRRLNSHAGKTCIILLNKQGFHAIRLISICPLLEILQLQDYFALLRKLDLAWCVTLWFVLLALLSCRPIFQVDSWRFVHIAFKVFETTKLTVLERLTRLICGVSARGHVACAEYQY